MKDRLPAASANNGNPIEELTRALLRTRRWLGSARRVAPLLPFVDSPSVLLCLDLNDSDNVHAVGRSVRLGTTTTPLLPLVIPARLPLSIRSQSRGLADNPTLITYRRRLRPS